MFNPIEKISGFYKSVMAELAKCTWPSWDELWESTLVVITSSVILSMFVFVVDMVIRQIIEYVT